MQQMIAIDANALDRLFDKIDALERKIDAATIHAGPAWLQLADYANKMNVSPRTVRNWVDAGRIEARGSGKAREIKVD